MIIVGIDPHKKSYTAVAIAAAVGSTMANITVRASRTGFASLLEWARTLAEERQFAIEDCRHVSGPLDLESFRLGRWFLSAGRLHLFTPSG